MKLFHASLLTLLSPIILTRFNGRPRKPITSVIVLILTIDKRRINFPFLVIDLRSNDILISRKFLEYYDLLLDYSTKEKKSKIYWPADIDLQPYFDRRLLLCLNAKPPLLDYE